MFLHFEILSAFRLTKQPYLLAPNGQNYAGSGPGLSARYPCVDIGPDRPAGSPGRGMSHSLSSRCTSGSIKKDVKRKSSPASRKPRKVSASSPPCRCAGASRRSSRVRGFAPRGHKFPSPPFPHIKEGFFRTARSGQGRAVSARRSEPLTARTVLRRFTTRERRSSNSIRFLKRNKRNGCICMWQP